jgi:sRNA-binding protein
VGLRFEEGLVTRILDDVKGAPGELPLLEHALLELYDRREGGCLSLSAYDEVGGIAGALVNRAETEFNKLDDFEKEILRKMFVLRMIQPGEGTEDTRRRATKEELLSIGSSLNKKFFGGPGGGFTKKPPGRRRQVENVLNRWIQARLLTATRDTRRDLVLVDVAHEALIRKWHKIREWMEEGRESARLTGILRQAVSEWLEENRSPDFLFQGARLVQMEGLVKTHAGDLTEDEIEFVKAGAALREAKERKELQAAQELADARARELKITRDLSAAKSKTLKRTRMIIAVIFLSLMAVTYLFYNSDKNEKKARRQLAVNHWENSRQAREKGELLYSFHLWAEAVAVNPDRAFREILLFDMNDYWNHLSLLHIF